MLKHHQWWFWAAHTHVCVSFLRFFPTSSQRASYRGNGKLHHDIRCSAAKLWCLCCCGSALPVHTGPTGSVHTDFSFDRCHFSCIIFTCTSLIPSLITLLSLSVTWHFLAPTDAPELSAAASEARHQHSASCPYHSNTGPKCHPWPGHGHPTTTSAHPNRPAEDSLWQGSSAFLYLHMPTTAKCTLNMSKVRHFVGQCFEDK